jgi:hypothetical protein
MSKTLVYERTGDGDKYLPLIISPENAKASVGGSIEAPFVITNSMREVQPEINLLVSPLPERLFTRAPDGAPEWALPVGVDDLRIPSHSVHPFRSNPYTDSDVFVHPLRRLS